MYEFCKLLKQPRKMGREGIATVLKITLGQEGLSKPQERKASLTCGHMNKTGSLNKGAIG